MKVLDISLHSSLTRLQWMSCADGAMVSGKEECHKITECLRWEGASDGHLVISTQARPPKAGCLWPCFQGGRLHALSGLSHPHSLKCFLIFRQTILCFSWCPLLLVFSLGTMKRAWLHLLLQPPFRCLYTLMRSSLSLFFSRLHSSSAQPFIIWKRF